MKKFNTVKTFANNPAIEERRFLFEVVGISQQGSNNLDYPIRQSGTSFIAVPYSRMNQEMTRINRLGGKIVNITPIGINTPVQAKSLSSSSETTTNNQPMTQAKDKKEKKR
ncbi:CpcD phycobilisome linker domain protein [Cyanobacterium stanieri PCC 7202]|uniref:CpcD phycobilisome linker domain protein n=1 Tax=Cyanobacterium stanieri (strain ATCC 29140 / PCC 7202) TaxID=292563 RepID=K9YM44_CYASC|nr:CpcD phycobilisome linker domain protein [Cyanobacterium stanieri PCC 7202]